METKQPTLEESFESLSRTALRVKAERDEFLEELRNMAANFESISELIDGYVDVEDGDYGQPRANKAMRAKQCADESISAIEKIIAKAEGR